ncbi:hypothetical protein [Alcaligenes faecalis]|uniref:hypothetical protein n=1 Tax=Alcaligenes faecalis TaxID=511 RepID=UPI00214FECC0|nr:hypothetical protein [Alcaligenes faecalis]MCR4142989.1 hypothetical protein [Alcaligenes faecalis]
MSKLLSCLSPLATLILAWLAFMFLLFFPPLWILWPVLVVSLGWINYRGIRYALGNSDKSKPWHLWFNVGECLLAVIVLTLLVRDLDVPAT